ncbi:cell wall-binding repeat-containing protein [Clostridium niameyense]|nr:cell wall-binding repeat-containing protein [Clostridium niameyense]
MSKEKTRALASATVVGLVLATAISTGNVQAAQGKVDRFDGANRYETAAKVAKSNWEAGKTENVILVSGQGYADALSASLLAQKLNAPVLLTEKDTLNQDTKNTLDYLGAKHVYILGSEGVVSNNIKTSLESEGKAVTRLAGKDRYETNIAIANELVTNHGVAANEVLVVNGNRYLADALTAAPVAAKEGKILLLVGEDASTANEAKKFIDAHSSKVTVIGRDVTVSDVIYNKLGASKRINGGADRFETNRLVLKAFGLQGSHVYIANGQDNHLVDSLVASALAGKFNSPVLLVSNDKDNDTKAMEYLKNELKVNGKTDLNVVGSEAILSKDIEKEIDEMVKPEPTTPEGDLEQAGKSEEEIVNNKESEMEDAWNKIAINKAIEDTTKESAAAKVTADKTNKVVTDLFEEVKASGDEKLKAETSKIVTALDALNKKIAEVDSSNKDAAAKLVSAKLSTKDKVALTTELAKKAGEARIEADKLNVLMSDTINVFRQSGNARLLGKSLMASQQINELAEKAADASIAARNTAISIREQAKREAEIAKEKEKQAIIDSVKDAVNAENKEKDVEDAWGKVADEIAKEEAQKQAQKDLEKQAQKDSESVKEDAKKEDDAWSKVGQPEEKPAEKTLEVVKAEDEKTNVDEDSKTAEVEISLNTKDKNSIKIKLVEKEGDKSEVKTVEDAAVNLGEDPSVTKEVKDNTITLNATKEGKSTITITCGDKTVTLKVDVKNDTVVVPAPASKVTVSSGSIEGAVAGDKKITVVAGKKYKVTVDGVAKYVKADGSLSDSEEEVAALTGTEITGLTNGKEYKVEEIAQK